MSGASLANKVIVVIGGTTGLGWSAARAMLAAGARGVVITGRNPENAASAAAGLGAQVITNDLISGSGSYLWLNNSVFMRYARDCPAGGDCDSATTVGSQGMFFTAPFGPSGGRELRFMPDGGLLLANQAGFVLARRGEAFVPVHRQPLPPLTGLAAGRNGELLALSIQGVMPVPTKP